MVGHQGGQCDGTQPAEIDLFAAYLSSFTPLAGDRRTARCSARRCAASSPANPCAAPASPPFPPGLAASRHAEKRIRRMVHGETTTRSPFDADDMLARLRARGVEQLRGEAAIWVILDGSDLRKPHARRWKACSGSSDWPGAGWCRATGRSTRSASGWSDADCCTTICSAARRTISSASRPRRNGVGGGGDGPRAAGRGGDLHRRCGLR